MRPRRINSRSRNRCTRDNLGTHLPPRCRRGYRVIRDGSVTACDGTVTPRSYGDGLDPGVAAGGIGRLEVAHLDDQPVAEAKKQRTLELRASVEDCLHGDEVLPRPDYIKPPGHRLPLEIAPDARDRLVLVVARAVRVDVGRIPHDLGVEQLEELFGRADRSDGLDVAHQS